MMAMLMFQARDSEPIFLAQITSNEAPNHELHLKVGWYGVQRHAPTFHRQKD